MKESTQLYSYRFGRFELQPSERRLLAAGMPAVLEPRAFDVLVALVERAGHLVTKEELLSRVWPKLIVEDANLHVQVSALRKILGPAAITTVPGQGYRFTLELTREVIDSAPLAAAKRDPPEVTFTASGHELADVHVVAEAVHSVPVLRNIAPSIRAFRESLEAAPRVPEQAAHRHPLDGVRRWPWLAGGIAIILIAAAAWLYQATKTTSQTTAVVEPPTLSIAILPIVASADGQLAATLTPEITAAFWRNARSAKMTSPQLVAPYQDKQVDARTIGHELNVRYVAEGEIRRAGGARLLSARLIDATNGVEIWTDQFEVPVEQLPGTYDVLATRVAMHIWYALYDVEQDRVAHQIPTNSNATDLWLRGAAIDIRPLDGALAARKLLEKALELDPRLVGAMRTLAFTYETELDTNPHADGHRLQKSLDELSLRAIAVDRTDPRAWELRTMALYYNNRLEESLAATAEMLRIEPNHVIARLWRGPPLIRLGRSEEALAELNQGIALDPSGPNIAAFLRQKCKAHSYLGQYERAIPICEKSATDERFVYPFAYLAADYAQLGEMDKAAAAKARLLQLDPRYTIASVRSALSLNVPPNPDWLRQAETYFIPGLRKAGIPEK